MSAHAYPKPGLYGNVRFYIVQSAAWQLLYKQRDASARVARS